jgi:hypothetical protein
MIPNRTFGQGIERGRAKSGALIIALTGWLDPGWPWAFSRVQPIHWKAALIGFAGRFSKSVALSRAAPHPTIESCRGTRT